MTIRVVAASQVIERVRLLIGQPAFNNQFLSDAELRRALNIVADDITAETPLSAKTYKIVGDGSTVEFDWPDDCWDIQTVEDESGQFRYPIISYEERKFAKFGFAWAITGYGTFGPYIRGRKIGFDPILANNDVRIIKYWGHVGRVTERAFVSSGTVAVTNGSKTVTGAGTSFALETVGTNGHGITIVFDNSDRVYTVDEILSNTSLTLTTEYEEADNATASYVLGEFFDAPQLALNAFVYGLMAKNYEASDEPDKFKRSFSMYRAAMTIVQGAWSRWQKQQADVVQIIE